MKAAQMRTGRVAELGSTPHGVTQPELIKVFGVHLPSSTRGKPQVLFNLAEGWTTKQSREGKNQTEMRRAFPRLLGESFPSCG